MSVSNGNKIVNKSQITCDEVTTVTLSFDAKSELISRPSDIILIIDRSSSMFGERMTFTKAGARDLIDMVVKASGGNTVIENGSRVALVTFSTTAEVEVPLTSDAQALNTALNAITTGGNTNHKAAFEAAYNLLDPQSTNDKIVIMFTDGITTEGKNPDSTAEAIKNEGAEIYCIGLVKDVTNLNKWSSDPDDIFVASTTDVNELQKLFQKVAYDVIKAGAKDVNITEKLNPEFKILKINSVTDGKVEIKDPQTLIWSMDGVGITENDTATLTFDIGYIGSAGGLINVNNSIIYLDRDGGELTFPNPQINVDCTSTIILPDSCTEATTFKMDSCKDAAIINVEEAKIQDLGRIVQIDVNIKNVCPRKKLAVGIVLTEIDGDGIEHARGTKTILVQGIESETCEDITLKCINFVLPEELDVTGQPDSMCNQRDFKARVLVNYVDTDFVCCDPETVIIND